MNRWRVLLMCATVLSAQLLGCSERKGAATYEDSEAYRVYSAVLPHSEHLLVRDQTQTRDLCLVPLDAQAARVLDPAITNYRELNDSSRRFQRRLDSKTDYELLSEEEVESTFDKGVSGPQSRSSWESFLRRHPGSHGWIELSAVGFNPSKTIAVVYIDHHCGEQCEAGEFIAMEKTNGSWKVLTGKGKWNHCVWVVDGQRV